LRSGWPSNTLSTQIGIHNTAAADHQPDKRQVSEHVGADALGLTQGRTRQREIEITEVSTS
jgi:hypothetical protein